MMDCVWKVRITQTIHITVPIQQLILQLLRRTSSSSDRT
jgi:hypothetical protein